MSSGGHAARLAPLTRDLLERWHQTCNVWRDVKAHEFEDRFMRELEAAVNSALVGMDRLETVLGNVRDDCE